MIAAHQFWAGPMTRSQVASAMALVKSGFSVTLWSLEPLDVPPGVKNMPAQSILLPESVSSRYGLLGTGVRDERISSVVLYADLFRLKLLLEHEGWWFDSDFLALRPAEDFESASQHRQVVMGSSSGKDVSAIDNSVLKFDDKQVLEQLYLRSLDRATRGVVLPWGAAGPELFQPIVHEYRLENQLFDNRYFYPISMRNAGRLRSLDKRDIDYCATACEGALGVHWWASTSQARQSQNNELVPSGSYLDTLFSSVL